MPHEHLAERARPPQQQLQTLLIFTEALRLQARLACYSFSYVSLFLHPAPVCLVCQLQQTGAG